MTEIQTPPDGTEQEMETPKETPETTPEPEAPETPVAPDPEPDPAPEPDYAKKFSESSSENQLLREQLKQKDAQIETLTTQNEPNDAELRAAFPEWDGLTSSEQRIARENVALKKSVASLQHTTAEVLADQRWQADLKRVKKKFSALAGHDEEFEEFVFKPTHKGVPVDILAENFLAKKPAASAPTPRTGLEPGSGGPKTLPKVKKLSVEEAATLRKTNYKEYKRLLLAGAIEEDID